MVKRVVAFTLQTNVSQKRGFLNERLQKYRWCFPACISRCGKVLFPNTAKFVCCDRLQQSKGEMQVKIQPRVSFPPHSENRSRETSLL